MSSTEQVSRWREVGRKELEEKGWIIREQLVPCLKKHLPDLAVLAVPSMTVIGAIKNEPGWPLTIPLFVLVLAARLGYRPPGSTSSFEK